MSLEYNTELESKTNRIHYRTIPFLSVNGLLREIAIIHFGRPCNIGKPSNKAQKFRVRRRPDNIRLQIRYLIQIVYRF